MRTLYILAILAVVAIFPLADPAGTTEVSTTNDWCIGTGAGVPILIEFPPNWTPEELMSHLGFNTAVADGRWLLELLKQWNRHTKIQFERNKPINRGVLRACYYWAHLPVYDSCIINGELAVCQVGEEWVPIYPRDVKWYLLEVPPIPKKST